jgi:hypothetical protein
VGLIVTLTPEPLPTSCRPIDTNHGGSRGVRPLQFLHLPIPGLHLHLLLLRHLLLLAHFR